MKQKGFLNIALIILVIVIAGTVGYFTFVKKSEVTKEHQLSSETENSFVLIGKRQTGSNANLYKGYVIVEGEYSVDYSDSILGGGTLYFTVDEQYRSKLPKRYDVYPQSFIFDNESSAKQMLNIHDGDKSVCSISGKARIALEDYTTELLESEVFDHTKLANVLSYTSPTIQKCKESAPVSENNGSNNSGSNIILRNDWNISFAKTSDWAVTSNATQQIELKQISGEWKGDKIIVQHVSGEKITDQDAKFGDVTYWYDQNINKWVRAGRMNDLTGVMEPSMVEATPKFYVAGDLPVFIGTERWLTYIIPLSHSSFLKFNITGSGYSQPLTDFVKTINKL